MARHLVSIDDLTNEEIEAIFQLADGFLDEMGTPGKPYRVQGRSRLASDFLLATLFFEPSTRTRLSFESAMLRLGGHCLSSADASQTSAAKGETIADMVRVIENYADAIVIRHPFEGAARVAADYASVPVINAGDGSHEHPTQTLCDLYTLRAAQAQKGGARTIQSLKGLNVVLWGDLRHGRTVHSLAYALARLRAHIIPRPAPGCDFPDHVRSRLARDYHCVPVGKEEIDDKLPPDVDVVYVTPDEPHQLALFPNIELHAQWKGFKSIDALYSTRLQSERRPADYAGQYPAVDAEFLKQKTYREAKVLHPLPRVDELSYEIDQDPRSVYFEQAAYGVAVRMALIAALLKIRPTLTGGDSPSAARYPIYARAGGIECGNESCVSRKKNELRYLTPRFWIVDEAKPTIRCVYCDVEQQPRAVGAISTKKYSTDLSEVKRIKKEDLILFADEQRAAAASFTLKKGKQKSKRPDSPLAASPP
jgi:aspartate carbamoyltransferase catalytic subunit